MGMLGNLYVLPMQDFSAAPYPKADGTLYKGFAYNDGDGSTGYDLDVPAPARRLRLEVPRCQPDVQPLGFAQMVDHYALINGRGYPDTIAVGSLPPVDGQHRRDERRRGRGAGADRQPVLRDGHRARR